jgi:glutathione S-transferase
MTTALKLRLHVDHFFISPYAFSAFVALEEKALPYHLATVSLAAKQQHEPSFRDRSLTARVPALEHDDFWLTESSAIIEYLEDAFPLANRVLPWELRDRARARQVLSWIRSDLMALREARSSNTIFFTRSTEPLGTAGTAARDKLVRVAGQILGDRDQLFSTWSIADADLAFMLMRLVANGDDVPEKLRSFAEKQWARPSIRKWVERERPPYVPYG